MMKTFLISNVVLFSAAEGFADKPQFKNVQYAQDKLDYLFHKQIEANLYCKKTPTKTFLIAGYDYLDQDNKGNNPGYDFNNFYQFLGLTHDFESLKLLASVGASETYQNIKKSYGSSDFNSVYGTLGIACNKNKFHYGIHSIFGYSFVDASRNEITNQKAHANYGSYTLSFDAHFSYSMKKGRAEIIPYYNPSYLYGHENSYTESGAGVFNFHVKDENLSVLRSTLGLKIVAPSSSWIKFFVDAAWLYEYFFDSKHFKAAYVGSSTYFDVSMSEPTKNYGRVDVGFMGSTNRFDWKLAYTGLFGNKFAQQAATLKLGYLF